MRMIIHSKIPPDRVMRFSGHKVLIKKASVIDGMESHSLAARALKALNFGVFSTYKVMSACVSKLGLWKI